MGRKGIPETLLTAVMSLCKGVKKKVKVGIYLKSLRYTLEYIRDKFYHYCCLPL